MEANKENYGMFLDISNITENKVKNELAIKLIEFCKENEGVSVTAYLLDDEGKSKVHNIINEVNV